MKGQRQIIADAIGKTSDSGNFLQTYMQLHDKQIISAKDLIERMGLSRLVRNEDLVPNYGCEEK